MTQNNIVPSQNGVDAFAPIDARPQLAVSSWLSASYHFIHRDLLPPFNWPAFETFLEKYQADRITTGRADIDVLPVAACMSAGGQAEQVLPVAASWILYILAGRLFDDLADGEGGERPWFDGHRSLTAMSGCLFAVSTANAALSYLDGATMYRDIATAFSHTLALAVKSENSRSPLSQLSVEAYFETIAAKTGLVFATGAWAGGRTVTDDEAVLDALYKYGLHLGMMTQILDDCLDLKTDLANQVWTLPIIYAVTQETHPAYKRLHKLLTQQRPTQNWIDEAAAVLAEMNAVSWSLQIAEAYRRQTVDIIKTLPYHQDVLTHYVTPRNK
jgi:hypothetical protein